ncbi:MAG TPA: J domain-containing protein [Gemmatimonadota bacterium]|nr:J domain-containing protein [Gemmatimonadota bacterium]
MRLDRAAPRELRDRYDEVVYREALQRIGIAPPVSPEAIRRAYKARAIRLHPDRFVDDDEGRDKATAKLQEVTAARDYALRHYRGFDLVQQRRMRARRPSGPPKAGGGWREWAMLPVTALYALATLVAAVPFLPARAAMPSERRARYVGRPGLVLAWRLWLVVAPHGLLLALCLSVPAPALRVWLAVAMLVMISSDLATLVTGDVNELRRHRAVTRARTFAEGVALAA